MEIDWSKGNKKCMSNPCGIHKEGKYRSQGCSSGYSPDKRSSQFQRYKNQCGFEGCENLKSRPAKMCKICIYESWRKYGGPMLGKKLSIQARLNSSKARMGPKHWNWKGGTAILNKKRWARIEYKDWRRAVFGRDNFTCQICRERGGRLEADHIKPFFLFPELEHSVDNGRTLCHSCH